MNHRYIYTLILILCIGLQSLHAQDEPKRELRAVWVASVSNLDWPKNDHRNQPELQKAELIRMLELYESINMNAILLQVRPECDALYNSAYEPWSRYLTWTQGDDPGYDPLQFAIDEAHKRGIEVHAWMNPYRINASTSDGGDYYHASHVYKEHPEWAIEYSNGKNILNPGLPEVMSYIGDVVEDLASKYAIDGIHFDDYFYSYDGTSNSLDQAEYDLYGNGMTRSDWRRDNVNRMIDTVYRVIQEVNPNIRFGVSPFGIYRPGIPSGISGLDAYNVIYCDPLAWLEDLNVDYLTPQLYWPTGGGQDFETLVNWWSQQVKTYNRHLYSGHGTYRLDDNPETKLKTTYIHEEKWYMDKKTNATIHEEKKYVDRKTNDPDKDTSDPVAEWTLSQVGLQIDLVRNNQSNNGLGSVFFRANDFDRVNGLANYIVDNKYTNKALVPEMTWKSADDPVAPTHISSDGSTVSWDYSGSESDRFAIYMSNEALDSLSIVSNADNLHKYVYTNQISFSDLDYESGSSIVITALSPIGKEGPPSSKFIIQADWPTVTLLTPANNQTVGFNDSLSWETSIETAESYIEIATGENFNNIVYSSNWITSTSIDMELPGLYGESTYYWRAKAKTSIEGPFCTPQSFITGFPQVPEITQPGQFAQNVSITPLIKWNATETSDDIEVVLAEDLEFTVNVYATSFTASEGQGMIMDSLNRSDWYYLKIQASNEFGNSAYTDVISFRTTDGEIPDITLLGPSHNSTVASFDELSWESSTTTGTISFQLEVSLDSDHQSNVYTSDWIPDTNKIIEALSLEGNTTYYWHVKARSEYGESEFSETRSFITGYPTKPDILQPLTLSSNISVHPLIEWSVDENTDSVYAEFSEDINFTSIYAHQTFDATLGSDTLSTKTLKGKTWYYLHIKALNEFGNSVFSSLHIFETEEVASISGNMNTYSENKIYQNQNQDIIIIPDNARNQPVKIEIYTILGKRIYNQYHSADKEEFVVDRSGIPAKGIYFFTIRIGKLQNTMKVLIE